MRSLQEIKEVLDRQRAVLAQKYGVAVVGVFGSYVRGEQTPKSDLDLLVEYVRPVSLLELVGAELHLAEILGIKVDLIPRQDVRSEIREAIFREAVAL